MMTCFVFCCCLLLTSSLFKAMTCERCNDGDDGIVIMMMTVMMIGSDGAGAGAGAGAAAGTHYDGGDNVNRKKI